MNEVAIRVPRRPIVEDPANPLEDWLSGKRTVRHEDGRLRRAATLEKYAWCLALVGYERDEIIALVRERDQQPEYRKFISKGGPWGRGRYEVMARGVLRNHEQWNARQKPRERTL